MTSPAPEKTGRRLPDGTTILYVMGILAIGLFDEIITSVGLNPFDEADGDQPAGSTGDP